MARFNDFAIQVKAHLAQCSVFQVAGDPIKSNLTSIDPYTETNCLHGSSLLCILVREVLKKGSSFVIILFNHVIDD